MSAIASEDLFRFAIEVVSKSNSRTSTNSSEILVFKRVRQAEF